MSGSSDAQVRELIAERDRLRALVGRMRRRICVWAKGIDSNKEWCWCGESDSEHRAPTDDNDHAAACRDLRVLMRDPDGQRAAEEWRALTALEKACRDGFVMPPQWLIDALSSVERARQR